MPLSVSWFLPNVENPLTETDAVISIATVRVIRQRDDRVVIDDDPATIDGNDTLYTIPADALQIDGDYTAYITVVFNDGITMSRRVDFRVVPRH